ncbi:uncharacterized protein N7469_004815 [Penicillium citrinum]|uniref:RNA polymerase II holoenzyme cyclin-like subunit n=1 Tax=Penicillium citrinum TaxID=5077 RepID=A0A9W9P7V4_PENCI|nr:uncharacterized protein N7469_004815 [Penicillium citrinum]KAJ5235647.1 hypothetical protein N7469_004815 [Penicillium citrinum]
MDQSQMIPAMPNPVVAAAQEKWMFTDEELERTPTRLDKIEREKEDYIRHRAVEFIWQVSMMLKMPPQTSMTATVLMHRFLMRYSLRGQYPDQAGDLMHPKVIAAVALFVAFKVDETMRRMKDFVVACCRVAMKKPDMVVDEQSKDYWKWRDLILQNESVMLEFLCFDLQLESPYRALWEYSLFFGVQDNRPLRHAAYAFLNDSTYTVLCLQFPPRVIAAAALYAAARHTQVAFPDDSQSRPWWEQIDVRIEDLIKSCKLIVKIYERVQQTLSKGYPDFAFSDTDPTDPTRLFNSNPTSFAHTPSHTSLTTPTATGEPGTPNGRKRSREPESHTADQKQPTPVPASLNGGRSPKRQRTISPMPGTTPASTNNSQAQPPRPRIPMRAMESTSQKPDLNSPRPSGEKAASTAPSASNQNPNTEEGEVEDDKTRAPESGDSRAQAQAPPSNHDEAGGSEEGEV